MQLQDIMLAVRQRSDMEDTEFITDPELISYINSSLTELYDILVSKFEDYYTLEPVVLSITSGNTAQLPSDFYKLRGLDRDLGGGDYAAMERFNFNERHRRDVSTIRSALKAADHQYRILGNKLIVTPKQTAQGNYQLWYIPQCPKLVNATDVADVIAGWEEYVVVDAAIKCMQKEESDVSVLLMQKQQLKQRIEEMAQNRDVDQPEQITDIYKARLWYDL